MHCTTKFVALHPVLVFVVYRYLLATPLLLCGRVILLT